MTLISRTPYSNDIPWTALDPIKAKYGATEGAYVAGHTLLAMKENLVVVCGHCSCSSKEDAENTARKLAGQRGDFPVSRKTLQSWFVAGAK